MSDPNYFCRTVFLPLDRDDWRLLHEIRADQRLDFYLRQRLTALLDVIQARAERHFAMVVWSVEDVHNAAARLRGADIYEGDEVHPSLRVFTDEEAMDIAMGVESLLEELMMPRAWEALEDAVGERIPDDSR